MNKREVSKKRTFWVTLTMAILFSFVCMWACNDAFLRGWYYWATSFAIFATLLLTGSYTLIWKWKREDGYDWANL